MSKNSDPPPPPFIAPLPPPLLYDRRKNNTCSAGVFYLKSCSADEKVTMFLPILRQVLAGTLNSDNLVMLARDK